MSLSNGFYPFWFWNDYLTREEIEWQVREMADKGIKGFYIHPRQGLKQPYLSESFFEMVDTAINEAEKHGLVVNIYDEYPYPSGIAGGEVVLGKPEYYATELIQQSDIVKGGRVRIEYPAGHILSAKAYPYKEGKVTWEREIDLRDYIGIILLEDSYIETGLTNYNQKRYFASRPIPVLDITLQDEQYKVFVSIQSEVRKHKYWNNFVDILNKDAVQRFLKLTHERYQKRYKDKFGSSIKSIFTDEIHPVWSDRIIGAFREEYGYDLLDYLPALQDESHPGYLRVSCDLDQLKYKMFCSSYEEQISGWCKDNKLLYVGEKPALRLSQLKYMDIPGCDSGHKKAGSMGKICSGDIRSNARAVTSATYFYNKEYSLCECYHSLGWSGTLQDAKLNAEELMALGIDILVPHGFFYSTHGLKKHDAPPSFFFQMPFWPLFGDLSRRIDNISQAFDGTHLDGEILLIDPTSGVYSEKNLRHYEDILSLLIKNHLDFLIGDTDIISSGIIRDEILEIRDLEIKLIIIPPMQKVEEPLLNLLEKFKLSGGKVINCKDGVDITGIKDKITNTVNPSLNIKQNGNKIEELIISKRNNKDKTIWFVVNTSDKKFKAVLEEENKLPLNELLIDKGYTTVCRKGNKNVYEKVIYPFESFAVEVDHSNKSITKNDPIPELIIDVPKQAVIEVENKNLLRMNLWEMSILDDSGNVMESSLVEAVPLSNQLKQGGFSFKPHFKEYFGHRPELDFPDMQLAYEYSFQKNYSGRVELLMEPETIKGEWVVDVNEKKEFTEKDFCDTDSHVRGSRAVDISDYLNHGVNNIKIKMSVSQPGDGLINPLYLAGDFGVSLNPTSIVEQQKKGMFEDYKQNLLPFYSGIIEYRSDFVLADIPDGEFVLLRFNYENKFHQATEISINDSEFQSVLWEPRCIKFPIKKLKSGKNIITTRVYTTLIRSFEGKWFDYEEHNYKTIEGNK